MRTSPRVLAALLVPLASACVQYEDSGPSGLGLFLDDAPALGTMTVHHREPPFRARPCESGPQPQPFPIPILPPARYCGERNIYLWGSADLAYFPFNLTTFAGDIEIRSGGTGWNLSVSIVHRGGSRPQVENGLLATNLEWRYREGNGHLLWAAVSSRSDSGTTADLRLTVERGLNLTGSATTDAGQAHAIEPNCRRLVLEAPHAVGVHAWDARCDALVARTNGPARVEGFFGDVDVQGASVKATLRPHRNATWLLDGTDGIELSVAESKAYGYDVRAHTERGRVSMNLQDGNTTAYSPQDKHFHTGDYDLRLRRALVTAASEKGSVYVSGA